MSNHFHRLVEEPDRNERPTLDRETLLQRLGFLYERSTVDARREELDRAAASGHLRWEQQIIERYQRRMGDVPHFHERAQAALQFLHPRRKQPRRPVGEN